MQSGVLRVLRATAASWWRHIELRRAGQTGLARQLERKAVLRDLAYLRQAATLPNAHVIFGEGGTFLQLGWTFPHSTERHPHGYSQVLHLRCRGADRPRACLQDLPAQLERTR